MKYKILLVIMCLGYSMVGSQNAPPNSNPELSRQDKKCVARIVALQKQIDDLEGAITRRQKAIETMARLTSASARATMPYLHPKPAVVLNTNGPFFIVNSGRKGDGLHQGDKLLIVRRTQKEWSIEGTGRVERAFDTDSECANVQNVGGIRPEDEVYVLDRCSSPHDVSRLSH